MNDSDDHQVGSYGGRVFARLGAVPDLTRIDALTGRSRAGAAAGLSVSAVSTQRFRGFSTSHSYRLGATSLSITPPVPNGRPVRLPKT